MQIAQILTPARVAVNVPATSKKAVLEQLAELIATDSAELTSGEVFDAFVARERLGSTGLGHGVAIPHCRVAHGDQARGALVRTAGSVDFDSIDNHPVNLFFALSVPHESTQEHLDFLAQIAAMFSDDDFTDRLRGVDSAEELFRLVNGWAPPA
ncbi:MAG: PTS IIA-like nitrogen regulatory protein PtsN [Gammaproteobacteria bacterium]|nr:PTS IIA-like nitrogen regulatory protein PtsN [Gammaproteobacteria bacterium]